MKDEKKLSNIKTKNIDKKKSQLNHQHLILKNVLIDRGKKN